jgi:hypothetical protein
MVLFYSQLVNISFYLPGIRVAAISRAGLEVLMRPCRGGRFPWHFQRGHLYTSLLRKRRVTACRANCGAGPCIHALRRTSHGATGVFMTTSHWSSLSPPRGLVLDQGPAIQCRASGGPGSLLGDGLKV